MYQQRTGRGILYQPLSLFALHMLHMLAQCNIIHSYIFLHEILQYQHLCSFSLRPFQSLSLSSSLYLNCISIFVSSMSATAISISYLYFSECLPCFPLSSLRRSHHISLSLISLYLSYLSSTSQLQLSPSLAHVHGVHMLPVQDHCVFSHM